MSIFLTPRFGANKIASVLLKYKYKVKIGDILAGTVIGIERTQTLINVGLKQAAFLPNTENFIEDSTRKGEILTTNERGEFVILCHFFIRVNMCT